MKASWKTGLVLAAELARAATFSEPVAASAEEIPEITCSRAAGVIIALETRRRAGNEDSLTATANDIRRSLLGLRLTHSDCKIPPSYNQIEACVDFATGTRPANDAETQTKRAYAAGACIGLMTPQGRQP